MKKLVDEEDSIFSISIYDLCSLFEPDNIRDGISNSKLKGLNGHIGLQQSLKTDLKKGLNDTATVEKNQRKEYFGTNDPVQKETATLWDMVKECFEDLMLQVLVVATVVSTVVGILNDGIETGWMEGVSILLAIVIIVSVGAGNNYVKEQQFQKLSAKKEEIYMPVVRSGRITQIHIKDLLVGDVLCVQIGDILPVDGILIDGSEVQMDESSITGESDSIMKLPVSKLDCKEDSCFMLSGSSVLDGQGRMLVLAVGPNTQMGKLRAKLQEETPPTPLQTKLESIAEDIGKIGTLAAGLTMVALWINLGIQIGFGKHCGLCGESLSEIINAFMIAVTIIVVAVPEGLPLAVTISLAFSVNKMKDENNLVKQLASCEIMGGCEDVCSDKTGTLTQNTMVCMKIYIEDSSLDALKVTKNDFSDRVIGIFCEGICVNSSANPKKVKGEWQQIGNKTECALLEVCDRLGVDYTPYRLNTERVLRTIPFSSSRKKMISVYFIDNTKVRVYVKGASEAVLASCSYVQTKFGQEMLTDQKKEQLTQDVIEVYADQALRTIGLAYKDMNYTPTLNINAMREDQLEQDLILLSIVGIKDPLRPNIKEAIQTCKRAGILTRMVTGDNVNTAVAIAKDCGILSDKFGKYQGNSRSYEVMEGKKFRELVGGLTYENPYANTPEGRGKPMVKDLQIFKQIASELRVLARSTPDDKYILVTGLIQLNRVVAVTGDGTNDAPALKKADVGFAMGITGTEVAKEAAGIILLDDNFASIITACKWGRNIYDSIRKFIQFQLTVNVVALFMSFMGSVVLKESPLNSIEMLWVNIIMDTFASLALSTEPPNLSLLERKPYGRSDSIVTSVMWRNVFGQSLYQIIVLTLLLFKGPEWLNIPSSVGMTKYDPEKAVHFSIFFQAFVLMQVFNEFNARKLKQDEYNVFGGIFNNSLFWVIIITTFLVQYLMIEFGGIYVQVTSLTLSQHLICLAIGAFSLVVGLVIKLIPPSLFARVNIFEEVELKEEQMDQTLTSKLRRKSTIRLGHVTSQKSLSKSQSIGKSGGGGMSLHSG